MKHEDLLERSSNACLYHQHGAGDGTFKFWWRCQCWARASFAECSELFNRLLGMIGLRGRLALAPTTTMPMGTNCPRVPRASGPDSKESVCFQCWSLKSAASITIVSYRLAAFEATIIQGTGLIEIPFVGS